jgi:hypothetical protein
MKNIWTLLICFTLLSCNKKSKQKTSNNSEKVYVISQEDIKAKVHFDSLKTNPPYVPKGVSCESNILIDKNNFVYYYQRRYIPTFCNYGMENDTLTHFLDLQPKDLIKIPKACIGKIINENVMTQEKRRQILVIASQNDTIKDLDFLRFMHQMKVPSYVIRRTTQEEDTVLHYKKTDKYYRSDEIKWDKKQIKF